MAGPAAPARCDTTSAATIDDVAESMTGCGTRAADSSSVSRVAKTLANTDPITATPRVPPSSRVVSFTADPTPALSGGSAPMMDSVAGLVVSPSPAATMIMLMTVRPA